MTANDKPRAAVVVDQQFAHGFLRSIRTLRHWAHGVGHFSGKIAAEYGHRTAEHHARATAKRTRALQNLPGGIEIDFHAQVERSEEHTSELQSLMRISYAVFCLKQKKRLTHNKNTKASKHRITKSK